MKYTKSELREAKNRIENILYKLSDKLPYVRTKDGWNWMYHKLVGDNLEELNQVLAPLKTHIIDNDDYSFAVEMNDKVTPVWKDYCKRANRGEFDIRQEPYPVDMDIEDGFLTNEREVHSEAFPVQATIRDLRAWIKEQEPSQTSPLLEAFFKVFEAVTRDCILSIGFKYRTRTEKPKLSDKIVQEFEAYRNTKPDKETFKREIVNQLSKCKSSSEVDQYVCSLLLPFKEICEVLRPSTPNNESKLFIKLLCTSAINHEKEKQGTVEYCLRCMLNDMNDYAILLYNVLIQYSIDLNEYQQNTGVYLRKEWNPANGMFFNLGDWDLIENLPLVETDNLDTEGVTIDAPQKKAEKPINTRTINEIELGKCFNAKFKGAGNNRNLFELLVSDLKDLNTIKDCSAVAVMIWESKSGFIKPSHAFAKWCRIFFGCINIKVTDNYNYSKKTKPTEELKRKFYYLV